MEEVHVGHYILGRTIGYGSFAKVKCTGCWPRGAPRLEWSASGDKDPEQAEDEEQEHDLEGMGIARQVKREIKILRFINHPNIIKLY